MRTVTPYYFATRRHSVIGKLPWHFRNELANLGYLELRPCYSNRTFRISSWLGFDLGSRFYDKVEPMRFSEADEPGSGMWEARMYPWEEENKGCTGRKSFGFDKRMRAIYVDRICDMLSLCWKYDRVGIAYPPFDGKPMVCALKDGKVTILNI